MPFTAARVNVLVLPAGLADQVFLQLVHNYLLLGVGGFIFCNR
jgi:hypothetical protein